MVSYETRRSNEWPLKAIKSFVRKVSETLHENDQPS